jgi:hypothetical protein
MISDSAGSQPAPTFGDAPLLHPVHHQIHNAAYNVGYAFGWLLIISPLLLLAWLALRLTH